MNKRYSSLVFSGLIFCGSNLALAGPAQTISDPMLYAETESRFFSEGDSNDSSGWAGCWYDDSQGQSVTHISCGGTRVILVHGGELFPVEFICNFIFSPNLNSKNGYYLEAGDCK